MLFWIFVGLVVAGVVFYIIFEEGLWVSGLGICCVLVSLFIFMCVHTNIDGHVAEYNARYDMLTYQLENDIYENDNDLGKRELMKDIQAWNEDIAYWKEAQDDFWIGIYVPDIYDQFEPIELGAMD